MRCFGRNPPSMKTTGRVVRELVCAAVGVWVASEAVPSLRIDGTVGERTSLTADDMAAKIGAEKLEPGDWITVARSPIDILNFEP